MKWTTKTALRTLALAGATAAAVLACSSSESRPGVTNGASDGGLGVTDARRSVVEGGGSGGEAGTCNHTMAPGAQKVMGQAVLADVPRATGGVIVPGKYFLTGLLDYHPDVDAIPPGAPYWQQETLLISATTFDSVYNSGDYAADGGVIPDGPDLVASEKWQTSGITLTLTMTCPTAGEVAVLPYSVAGNTLHIFDPPGTEAIYTLQP